MWLQFLGVVFAGKLATLALNGNRIVSVAQELGQCSQLRNLSLQANQIRELPEEMTQLHVSDSKLLHIHRTSNDVIQCNRLSGRWVE